MGALMHAKRKDEKDKLEDGFKKRAGLQTNSPQVHKNSE
jgi:hypothetical protein